ncbi:MAG: hypothetical protein Sapg2KO_10080 [Saprospiraceae bacterium]
MKKESKYLKYLEWAFMLILFLGMLIITKESALLDSLKPDSKAEKTILMLGIIVMVFIVLAVHELGHLLVGLVNGFRFELYVIGPLGIKRENDQVKTYLNKNLAYYGGIAATSPIDNNKDNAKKFARILLAGPIASVLFAIICFVIAFLVGKPLGIVFYTGGLMSIGIFLATTIPSRTGMFFTDRKRYQRLVRPGKDQEVELALLSIMGQYAKDNSYKNIDWNDINTLITDQLPFIQFFGLFNLICYQLETNGVIEEETTKAYEKTAENMSKQMVNAFNQEIEKFKAKLLDG